MTRTKCPIGPILAVLFLLVAVPSGAPAAGFPWKAFAARPDSWYRGDEAARLAENVLSHQSERGDWPKNVDTSAAPYRGDRSRLRGTFDNGATVGEMRFLARAFVATGRARYRDAFIRARPRAGRAVPERRMAAIVPARPGVRPLYHIQRQHDGQPPEARPRRGAGRWLPVRRSRRREAADRAFAAGIACIVRCQVRVDGRLTAWWRSTTRRPSSLAVPGRTSCRRKAAWRARES